METDSEKDAVMQSYKEGKSIELAYRGFDQLDWRPFTKTGGMDPVWKWDMFIYRVSKK